ncbi:MAG: dTMP kinase [Candidatus Daviesbacteria bacterium]|nr:dTMP kinase [Candidatus Daviesbacteria bacterium]
MKKGQLIVLEGIDGSGKTTQINLLAKSLAEKNIPFEVISFPRYEDNLYGKLVKRYLEGEFGSISEVSPYLMALVYAGDRFLAKPLIEKWLNDSRVVLVNRYVSASHAHMGANLPETEREEFFEWLDELEYQTNRMPKKDLTILLAVDPKIGQKNVVGRSPDLHEENIKHLEEANKIYLELAKKEANWYVINCMKDDQMKSVEDIHQELLSILEKVKQ